MIHPATLGDLWALRRKTRSTVMLYNEALLVRPHRWSWFALRDVLNGNGREGLTLVYRERGMRSVLQSLGRNGRPEQDIVMLAASGGGRGHPTDPDVWFRLIETLCANAGRFHVERIYAALSQRHEELRELFRQLGFAGYTQQTVMRLQGPDWDQGTTLAPMRPQSRGDIWAIHKLYGATTPRPVQQMEARDSRSWMLPMSQSWRGTRVRGWVLGPRDDLTAYLHLTSGSLAHVLTLLLSPEHRDIITDLLRFGLGQIPDDLPVYLLLRDYQRELLLPAEDLGFQPIGEQMLLCKQTTVAVRRLSLVPALEPRLESRGPIPTISSFGEDARPYVRTTRHYQQYRTAPGGAATEHTEGS
jgi:hypothetical protein